MTGQSFRSRPEVLTSDSRRTVVPKDYVLDNDLLPWHHFVTGANMPDHTFGTVGGLRVANNLWYFGVINWTTTINAEIAYDFYLGAGTWRMEWYCDKRGDYGNIRLLVDGVTKETVDHYAATRVRFVRRVDGIVLTQGWHRFMMRCIGKNAASTAYVMVFSGLSLTRTA